VVREDSKDKNPPTEAVERQHRKRHNRYPGPTRFDLAPYREKAT
jgi:hypothetical protein